MGVLTKIGVLRLLDHPVIICDDEIEVGDTFLHTHQNRLFTVVSIRDGAFITKKYPLDTYPISEYTKKVLLYPDQFSNEFIQSIVDRRMKDGDKVEVEMETYYTSSQLPSEQYKNQRVKLHNYNTAIIHPFKKSVEEIAINYVEELAINYVTKHWGSYPNNEWTYSEGYNSFIAGYNQCKTDNNI